MYIPFFHHGHHGHDAVAAVDLNNTAELRVSIVLLDLLALVAIKDKRRIISLS